MSWTQLKDRVTFGQTSCIFFTQTLFISTSYIFKIITKLRTRGTPQGRHLVWFGLLSLILTICSQWHEFKQGILSLNYCRFVSRVILTNPLHRPVLISPPGGAQLVLMLVGGTRVPGANPQGEHTVQTPLRKALSGPGLEPWTLLLRDNNGPALTSSDQL